MAAPDGGDVLGTTLMTLTILYSLSQYMTNYWSKINVYERIDLRSFLHQFN